MAERYGFFNSVNKDRVYDASDVARFLKKYFTNGVFNNTLQVKSNDNMTVSVSVGQANINGYSYELDSELTLNIAESDNVLSRIDSVILRLDLVNRQITAQILQGSYATDPSQPTITRTETIYDLRLANVSVPAGATRITADMITDTRFGSDCGNVVGAVQQIDTTDVFKQYETYFNNWFKTLEDELSENQAGNLQNQINSLNDSVIQNGSYTTCTYDETNSNYKCNLARILSNGDSFQLMLPLSNQNDSNDSNVSISVDGGTTYYNLLDKTGEFNLMSSDFEYKNIYLKAVFNGSNFVLISPDRIKNIVSAKIAEDITTTTNGTINNLTKNTQQGERIKIKNGIIEIGDGVKRIKASLTMTIQTQTANQVGWQPYLKYMKKGDSEYTNLATVRDICEANEYNSLSITDFLVFVNPGDKFTLGWYKGTSYSIKVKSGSLSAITIEEI